MPDKEDGNESLAGVIVALIFSCLSGLSFIFFVLGKFLWDNNWDQDYLIFIVIYVNNLMGYFDSYPVIFQIIDSLTEDDYDLSTFECNFQVFFRILGMGLQYFFFSVLIHGV